MSDAFRILLGAADVADFLTDGFDPALEWAGVIALFCVAVRWTARRWTTATKQPGGGVE